MVKNPSDFVKPSFVFKWSPPPRILCDSLLSQEPSNFLCFNFSLYTVHQTFPTQLPYPNGPPTKCTPSFLIPASHPFLFQTPIVCVSPHPFSAYPPWFLVCFPQFFSPLQILWYSAPNRLLTQAPSPFPFHFLLVGCAGVSVIPPRYFFFGCDFSFF